MATLKVILLLCTFSILSFSQENHEAYLNDLKVQLIDILNIDRPGDLVFKKINIDHQRTIFLSLGNFQLVDDLVFKFEKNGNSYEGFCITKYMNPKDSKNKKFFVKCKFKDSHGVFSDMYDSKSISQQSLILSGKNPILPIEVPTQNLNTFHEKSHAGSK